MPLRTIPDRFEVIPDARFYTPGKTADAMLLRTMIQNGNYIWARSGLIHAAYGEEDDGVTQTATQWLWRRVTNVGDQVTLGMFSFPDDDSRDLRLLGWFGVASASSHDVSIGVAFLLPGETTVSALTPVTWYQHTGTSGWWEERTIRVQASSGGVVRMALLMRANSGHTNGVSVAPEMLTICRDGPATGSSWRGATLPSRPVYNVTGLGFANYALDTATLRMLSHSFLALWGRPQLVYTYNGQGSMMVTHSASAQANLGAFVLQKHKGLSSAELSTLTVKARVKVHGQSAAGTLGLWLDGALQGTAQASSATTSDGVTYWSHTDFTFTVSGVRRDVDHYLRLLWTPTANAASNNNETNIGGARLMYAVGTWANIKAQPGWSYEPMDEDQVRGGRVIHAGLSSDGNRGGLYWLERCLYWLWANRSAETAFAWFANRMPLFTTAGSIVSGANSAYIPNGTSAGNTTGTSTVRYVHPTAAGGPSYGYSVGRMAYLSQLGTAIRLIGRPFLKMRSGGTNAPPEFATIKLMPDGYSGDAETKSYLVADAAALQGGFTQSGYEKAFRASVDHNLQVSFQAGICGDTDVGLRALYACERPLTSTDLDALA